MQGRVNDLSYVLDNQLIVLIEHQSTINDAMPYRMLQYIADTYNSMYDSDLQYRRNMFLLKRPKFIVFYNGEEDMEDMRILRLSDMYVKYPAEALAADNGLIDLELTVTVYNIKDGRNAHIVKYCVTLQGYVIFTDKIREYRKTIPLEEAIIKAVDYCIANDILKEFLQKHKKEIVGMLLEEWNWDTALAVREEEGFEKGMEKGREEGIEIGMEKGEGIAAERIAHAMKEEGADVHFIAKVTNLSIDAIQKL
ncbi:hypothetical protein R80B4_03258 [Fibrobacteres bacterium R8-0-B4]